MRAENKLSHLGHHVLVEQDVARLEVEVDDFRSGNALLCSMRRAHRERLRGKLPPASSFTVGNDSPCPTE
jgi:hypothetical protein